MDAVSILYNVDMKHEESSPVLPLMFSLRAWTISTPVVS
jgi:hypothetical protein